MIDWDSCVLWLDSKYFSESYWWDRSKYRNNGVVHGAKWKANAFYFDGNNDYVDCGEASVLNLTSELTLEVLFNTSEFFDPSYQGLIQRGNWNNGYFLAVRTAEPHMLRMWFRKDNSGDPVDFGETEVDRWYHAVVTLEEDGTAKGYLNGKLEVTETGCTLGSSIAFLCIGAFFGTVRFHKGKIAVVRIYDEALNEEEIKVLYRSSYRKL